MNRSTCDHEEHRSGLDSWSPLALHAEDLDGAETQQQMLSRALTELVADPAPESPVQPGAWTGDRAGSVDLHHDPRLTWLCRSVGAAAHTYLERLGHDRAEVTMTVERAWGIVSRPGDAVAPRTHHDADLTAIYYVTGTAEGGALRFVNSSRGIHSDVDAVPGRVVVFPSRQRHEMLPNTSCETQLSIVFEITISRCGDGWACSGTRPSSPGARPLPDPRRCRPGVPGMVDLDSLRLHSAPAPGNDETLGTIVPGIPPDPATWRHFRAAADRLRTLLVDLGVDTTDASVSIPSVSWRRDGNRSLFGRAPTDLQIYVRADDGDAACVIETAGDTMPLVLRTGVPAVVSGDRPHRLVGEGLIMRFGVDLPSVTDDRAFDDLIEEAFVLHVLEDGRFVTGTRSGRDGHRRDLFPVG